MAARAYRRVYEPSFRTLPCGLTKEGKFMTADRLKVLIVDDDPSHLEVYGMLLARAGYEALTAQVSFAGADLPQKAGVKLVLLDYKLQSLRTSAEFAREIKELYPAAPIILLSDLWSLPEDIAPLVTEFVRKGQPARLLQVVERLLPRAEEAATANKG
jgi:DNA-binding NtrC family response regulator